MPIDAGRLKKKAGELGVKVKEIALALGIDESTYYRKMADNGNTFSVAQAQKLTELLQLSKEEAREIFLP